MPMGVKDPAQEQEEELLFWHFMGLCQCVFNERDSGVFFSFCPL